VKRWWIFSRLSILYFRYIRYIIFRATSYRSVSIGCKVHLCEYGIWINAFSIPIKDTAWTRYGLVTETSIIGPLFELLNWLTAIVATQWTCADPSGHAIPAWTHGRAMRKTNWSNQCGGSLLIGDDDRAMMMISRCCYYNKAEQSRNWLPYLAVVRWLQAS